MCLETFKVVLIILYESDDFLFDESFTAKVVTAWSSKPKPKDFLFTKV